MWMLAVMNGGDAQTIQVPLSFLGEGRYQAKLVGDHEEDSGAVTLPDKTVQRGDVLAIEMIAGGGFVGRFTK